MCSEASNSSWCLNCALYHLRFFSQFWRSLYITRGRDHILNFCLSFPSSLGSLPSCPSIRHMPDKSCIMCTIISLKPYLNKNSVQTCKWTLPRPFHHEQPFFFSDPKKIPCIIQSSRKRKDREPDGIYTITLSRHSHCTWEQTNYTGPRWEHTEGPGPLKFTTKPGHKTGLTEVMTSMVNPVVDPKPVW